MTRPDAQKPVISECSISPALPEYYCRDATAILSWPTLGQYALFKKAGTLGRPVLLSYEVLGLEIGVLLFAFKIVFRFCIFKTRFWNCETVISIVKRDKLCYAFLSPLLGSFIYLFFCLLV